MPIVYASPQFCSLTGADSSLSHLLFTCEAFYIAPGTVVAHLHCKSLKVRHLTKSTYSKITCSKYSDILQDTRLERWWGGTAGSYRVQARLGSR